MKHVERFYTELSHKERNTTSPLLLDSVVTPMLSPHAAVLTSLLQLNVSSCARQERDNALLLARQYRDIAEECQTEKRRLKAQVRRKD